MDRLREALLDKLEEQRTDEPHCVIQWSDTRTLEVIRQSDLHVSPSEPIRRNAMYSVYFDHQRRTGVVLFKGTKYECETDLKNRSTSSSTPSNSAEDMVNDMVIMRILAKLLQVKEKPSEDFQAEDVHDVQCAGCQVKPIFYHDRFHCLECSTSSSSFDLCGPCFEKRRRIDRHESGHAMIHFRLPKEFLGISTDDISSELNLQQIRRISSLTNEKHEGVTCDGECGRKDFIGLRFKCDICPNYNLCERCAIDRRVLTKNHQREHPIILCSTRIIPKISLNDIQQGEEIGRGSFGYVCRSKWISKNRPVAVKVIEATGRLSEQLQQSFLDELAAYRELSGPYIVRIFGYATRVIPGNGFRDPVNQYHIIMEFMSRGSLERLLRNEPHHLSLRRKVTMARQIASGMRRIHEHRMIHRDIRPDNILVTEKYTAKIGDMGIVRELDPTKRHTEIGCREFMPPEFYRPGHDGRIRCDEKLDVYTYGLTLNQLFTETFHDFRLTGQSSEIIIKKSSPIFFEEIILRCLNEDSKQRPTAAEIEKTLEVYEKAFNETMLTDTYISMNTKEKDQKFIDFYQKNRNMIQRVLKENLPSEMKKNISIPIHHEPRSQSAIQPTDKPVENNCRMS